ncbi:MAG: hypothetical protein ACFFF4_17875 [Candidatus Thorarchaeota archaeon]
MKRTKISIIIVAVITILIAPNAAYAIGPQQDTVDYWSEMVGYTYTTFAYPIFVLYDPPGDGSYAKYEKISSSGIGWDLELLGGPFPVAVDVDIDTTFYTGSSVQTSDTIELDHAVICSHYMQRWELWFYMTPRTSFYRLKCVSNAVAGWGWYGLDDLHETTWVTDKTGTEGPYTSSRHANGGQRGEDWYMTETNAHVGVGLGIKVTIDGLTFELVTHLTFDQGTSVKVTYSYYDTDDMDFYINSEMSLPLQIGGSLEGNCIWFNPGTA